PMTHPDPTPFHAGERAVQSMLGVRESIEPWARKVVRSFLPEEHREFYAALPFLVLAARDERDRPWVSLVTGKPGFATSPSPGALRIQASVARGDGLEHALGNGSKLGILGIELATRRRNRLNGRVSDADETGFAVEVDQSFGNCPQYIREREWRVAEPASAGRAAERHSILSAEMAAWIEGADTFFIGSGFAGEDDDPRSGMDASHRGGEPGFVRVENDRVLTFPDYAGNNHYNTIGNLVVDSRAALTFVDFGTGSLLQLTGRAEIDWDSDAVAEISGARRLIRFTLDEAILIEGALPLRWSADATMAHPLRLIEKQRESDDVTSFVFRSEEGEPLADFSAGQYLPIVLEPPGGEQLRRTYSLSGRRDADHYRISVKREPNGAASGYLHDSVVVGDVIEAGLPAGDFVLDHGGRPVVLVSAGIGATPLVSMLHELASKGAGRSAWFIHGARDGRHHALAEEVRRVADGASPVRLHTAYSRPGPNDVLGTDYHSKGRIDGSLLANVLPDLDAEFYLCGPLAFMAQLQAELEQLGVPDDQIHTESFGPVG
ncbi:MAG: pyridoxamine 5'-phosphate oxidase family protein, partial [Myxococcota bacterium]